MTTKLFDLVDDLLLSVFRDINRDGERGQRLGVYDDTYPPRCRM
jgi:hypothetical protein